MKTSASLTRYAWMAALVAAAALTPKSAAAQGTGQVVQINPSVRAAGMGDAGTAVFWGADANDWANPALLGYQSGLQYRWSRTQLVPGLSTDIVYGTSRLTYGWGGIGLAASNLRLDFGESQGTDEQGNPTGTFASFERVRPLGIGLSVSRLIVTFAALRGGEAPAITRYADLAFGFDHKRLKIDLAPGTSAGAASATSSDYGVLLRVSPLPGADRKPSLDFSYGFAALNYDDAAFAFPNEDQVSLVTRQYRNGGAARFAVPTSDDIQQSLRRPFGRWIARGMDPLISLGLAMDFVHYQEGQNGFAIDVDQIGVEVELLSLVSARVGHVTDKYGEIDGTAYGLGVGIPVGGFSGVRYDFASTPQSQGSDSLHRHAITAWFDPVAFARR